MWSFYGIKHNKWGVAPNKVHASYFPILSSRGNISKSDSKEPSVVSEKLFGHRKQAEIIGFPEDKSKRRKVFIATLEYDIIDWKLKVEIGGLGLISSLMGKAMNGPDMPTQSTYPLIQQASSNSFNASLSDTNSRTAPCQCPAAKASNLDSTCAVDLQVMSWIRGGRRHPERRITPATSSSFDEAMSLISSTSTTTQFSPDSATLHMVPPPIDT
jgi:hypothetical protein